MTSFKEVAKTINDVIKEVDSLGEQERKRRNEIWQLYDKLLHEDPILVAAQTTEQDATRFLNESISELIPASSLLSRDNEETVYIVVGHSSYYVNLVRFTENMKECSIHLSKLGEFNPISLEDISDPVLRKKVGKKVAKMRLAKMKGLGER